MILRNANIDQLYQIIFEQCVEGVMVINRSEEIVLLNPHAAKMLEYDSEELIYKPLERVIPSYASSAYPSLIKQFFDNPIPLPIGKGIQLYVKKKSGNLLPVEISLSPMTIEGQIFVITHIIDISPRLEVEKKVQNIEAHQKAILDSTVSHMLLLDLEGNIRAFNQTAQRWNDNLLKKEFKVDYAFNDWLPEQVKGKFDILFQRAKEGEKQRVEAKVYDHWFEVNFIPFKGNDHITGVCIDARIINEQKSIQKALIEREAFTQSVLGSLSANIAVIDNKGEILAVNQAWKRFGKENAKDRLPNIGIGINYLTTCQIAADQGDVLASRALEGIHNVLNGNELMFTMEYPCHSPTVKRWYLMRVTPLESSQAGAVIAHEDITKRKLAEEAIRESEQKYSSLISAMAEGIVMQSRTGEIITCNPSAERILGLTENQLRGRTSLDPHWQAIREDGSPFPGNEHPSMVTLRTGKCCSKVIMGVHKPNGELTWISINSEPLEREGEDQPYAVVSSLTDITQQKNAEEKLKGYSVELEKRVSSRTEALREAIRNLEKEINERKRIQDKLLKSKEETQQALTKEKELNELKSRFVSMASHEFRTPLATILSSINLINRYESESANERVEKHINRIRDNVKHLTNMLNDFLSLSKLEEGLLTAIPEEIVLDEFIPGIIEEMMTQVKEGQKIIYDPQQIPEVIQQDPKMLRNVLHNLLSNAIKYSPEYKDIYIYASPYSKENILIEIKDQGIGIPEADQAHLFSRFFRAHNVSNIQGTGLGLNIVKRYVELMGGEISFKSVIHQGTAFFVNLPQTLNVIPS